MILSNHSGVILTCLKKVLVSWRRHTRTGLLVDSQEVDRAAVAVATGRLEVDAGAAAGPGAVAAGAVAGVSRGALSRQPG